MHLACLICGLQDTASSTSESVSRGCITLPLCFCWYTPIVSACYVCLFIFVFITTRFVANKSYSHWQTEASLSACSTLHLASFVKSALSRISPRIRVRVSVSIVLGLATGGYSWIWPWNQFHTLCSHKCIILCKFHHWMHRMLCSVWKKESYIARLVFQRSC